MFAGPPVPTVPFVLPGSGAPPVFVFDGSGAPPAFGSPPALSLPFVFPRSGAPPVLIGPTGFGIFAEPSFPRPVQAARPHADTSRPRRRTGKRQEAIRTSGGYQGSAAACYAYAVNGRTVDRSLVRMIAYKRIVTGSLSLTAAVALSVLVAARGGVPPASFALALLLFVGGGAWSLRDGLRLRRELRLR